MQNRPVGQGEGTVGGAGGLNRGVGGHAVDELPLLLHFGGDEQPAVYADPKPPHSLGTGGNLHKNTGQIASDFVAGGGNLIGLQVQHGFVGGDMLGQIGGFFVRRGLRIGLGTVLPII